MKTQKRQLIWIFLEELKDAQLKISWACLGREGYSKDSSITT